VLYCQIHFPQQDSGSLATIFQRFVVILGMTREDLIATVARITELRSQIANLASLQKELKRLEALIDSVPGVVSGPAPARNRQSVSIAEKIGQFLETRAHMEWSAEELAHQIDAKLPTVRASLSKLRKAGRIIDTRRGHVQAKNAADITEGDTRLAA